MEESKADQTHENVLGNLDSSMTWVTLQTHAVAPHKKLELLKTSHLVFILAQCEFWNLDLFCTFDHWKKPLCVVVIES